MQKRERSPEGEPLPSILDGLLTERPWRSGLLLGRLGRRWEDVVGERLAHECSPASLDQGVLVVRVSSTAWARQVAFLSAEVRARANETLGQEVVRDVRTVVDAGPRDGR